MSSTSKKAKTKKDAVTQAPAPPKPYPNPFADLVAALERFSDCAMGANGWKRIDLTIIAEGDGPSLNIVWPAG